MLTEQDTIQSLIDVDTQLENVTRYHAKILEKAYHAKITFKLAMAKARITIKNDNPKATVGIIEDMALLQCENEYGIQMVSEAELLATQETMRTLRERCNTGRSLNASVRGQTNDGSF